MLIECPLCQAAPADPTFAVCQSCATTLALQPMPPSKRPPLPCHRCNHREFVRVMPRELSTAPGESYDREVAPMFAVYAPTVSGRLIFAGREVNAPDPQNGAGKMEMYICRGCGFTEWYCQDPSEIPIDPLYSTEAVSVGGDGPLR